MTPLSAMSAADRATLSAHQQIEECLLTDKERQEAAGRAARWQTERERRQRWNQRKERIGKVLWPILAIINALIYPCAALYLLVHIPQEQQALAWLIVVMIAWLARVDR